MHSQINTHFIITTHWVHSGVTRCILCLNKPFKTEKNRAGRPVMNVNNNDKYVYTYMTPEDLSF